MNILVFNNDIPIYIQIINKLKIDIVKKIYASGDKLPSVRELGVLLKVNPNTVQRAYQELDREGITYTKRGTGTYVTEDDAKIRNIKKQFAEDIFKKFIKKARKAGFSDQEIVEKVKVYLKEEK